MQTIKLRDYQQKLLEVCKSRNSILYLPTGSGKTLIAVKVIETFINDLKTPLSEGGKRSLFLVNTVCLGNQIADEVKKLLGLEVACWNSETHKKTWNEQKFREEYDKKQVIVATAQLFVDAVKHSFISLEQINVIIFDECHHGRKNHPYHEMMKQFQYIKSSKQPRVIGLSGMLIGISSSLTENTVEKELQALESTFLSTIVTVHHLQDYKNVLLHSTNPKEGCLRYNTTLPCELQKNLIEKVHKIRWTLGMMKTDSILRIDPQSLRQTKPKKLKELSLLFEDFSYELQEMGIYGGYLSLQAIRIQFELIKKQPSLQRRILEAVNFCLENVKILLDMIKDEVDFKKITTEKIIFNSSLKVRTLIGIMKQKFTATEREQDMQCLVFVQRRFTAKCLYHLFKRFSELEPNLPIIADFVVGVNSELPESIDVVMNLSMNKFAIEKFRMKETNCIFTSSVMEEGMDLQMCNLVLMYDFPTTFRSYVQSKGRARTKNSDYIVLLPSSDVKFLSKCIQYNAIDKNLKKILIGKTCDRQLSEEGIERERNEVWKPMITERRALMNNISSVALLNQYVSKFGNMNQLWDRKDYGPGKIVAIVNLPRQSKINFPIHSDPFGDIKLSKQNAAFKACQALHKVGELDENLMPHYH